MAKQRLTVRTCDQCKGARKDLINIPRYQWFLVIGVALASAGGALGPQHIGGEALVAGGAAIGIFAIILWFRAHDAGCPICRGTGVQRLKESVYRPDEEKTPPEPD
ncbi:MAG TPA: hypothetical protein PK093_20425 [Phycisphaerae bacterium]|nr:hypothetical protein [Phycisphaerae bacterium]